MQTKRKTIGRTLSSTPLSHLSLEHNHSQRFTLQSGKSVLFRLEQVPANELEEKTFVRFLVNGRDQAALTEESLSDIIRTIKLQQFFPAIGYRVNNKIEILDGSRRRAAALFSGVGLSVLVSETEISNEDARQLAADIQTAKEHNLREIGLRLIELRKSGMSQKEIAQVQNMSAAKVTRAIQAASVAQEIIELFPIQADLTYPDYKLLLAIDKIIRSKGIPLQDVISQANHKINDFVINKKVISDEFKCIILDVLKEVTNHLVLKTEKQSVMVKSLWSFDDKNMYARKRIKGRGFSYEFNRIPKQLQDQLDKLIQENINEYFETETFRQK
ncbi:ParB family protein [Providencia rettgeri]